MTLVKYSTAKGNNVGEIMLADTFEFAFNKFGVSIETRDILFRTVRSFSLSKDRASAKVKYSTSLQQNFPRLFSWLKLLVFFKNDEQAKINNVANNAGILILGGGNILMNKMGSDYGFRVGRFAAAFRKKGKKTFVMGSGCGPFEFNEKKLLSKIYNNCESISVRDESSKAYFSKYGFKHVKKVYDPAFIISDIAPKLEGVVKTKFGINLIEFSEGEKITKNWISSLNLFLNNNELQLVFIVSALPGDLIFTEQVQKQLMNNGIKAEIRVLESNPKSIANSYSDLKYFYGSRMHSLIFAISYEVTSFGYIWDKKVTGMFQMVFGDQGESFCFESLFNEEFFEKMNTYSNDFPIIPIAQIKSDVYKYVEDVVKEM
jgi:polysaccharide pyruvyl transferase WcaK-like protein